MSKKKREVKFGSNPSDKRRVNLTEDPNEFNSKSPVWKFSDIDFDGTWGWNYLGSIVRFENSPETDDILLENDDEIAIDGINRMCNKYYTYDKFIAHLNRNCKESTSIKLLSKLIRHLKKDYLKTKLIDKLSEFENASWENLKRRRYGKYGKTKHHYQDTNDIIPEAQKRLIELNLDDANLFTFRLDGSMRVWGILDRGVFSLLWFDPYHEIYPTEGKDNNTRIIK